MKKRLTDDADIVFDRHGMFDSPPDEDYPLLTEDFSITDNGLPGCDEITPYMREWTGTGEIEDDYKISPMTYMHYVNACCLEAAKGTMKPEELYCGIQAELLHAVNDYSLWKEYRRLERKFAEEHCGTEDLTMICDIPDVPEICFDEDITLFIPGSPVSLSSMEGCLMHEQLQQAVLSIAGYLLDETEDSADQEVSRVIAACLKNCCTLAAVRDTGSLYETYSRYARAENRKLAVLPENRAYAHHHASGLTEVFSLQERTYMTAAADLSILVCSALTQQYGSDEEKKIFAEKLADLLRKHVRI